MTRGRRIKNRRQFVGAGFELAPDLETLRRGCTPHLLAQRARSTITCRCCIPFLFCSASGDFCLTCAMKRRYLNTTRIHSCIH